jgi:hypothetical protein
VGADKTPSNGKVRSSNKVEYREDAQYHNLVDDESDKEDEDEDDDLKLHQYARQNSTTTGRIFHVKYLTPNKSITRADLIQQCARDNLKAKRANMELVIETMIRDHNALKD